MHEEQTLTITRTELPNMVATLALFASPAGQALDKAIENRAKELDGDTKQAVETVPHLDVVTDWCRQNPELAARCVLTAVYIANGRFIVQEVSSTEPAAPAEEAATA